MKSCCLLMKKEDFPVNPSREGFKLRLNNESANSSFCAVKMLTFLETSRKEFSQHSDKILNKSDKHIARHVSFAILGTRDV